MSRSASWLGSPGRVERRSIQFAIVGLVVLTVIAWLGGCSMDPDDTVILLILDTTRRDALGCYSNTFDATPHIDAVAEEGVRFNQAIATSGWTLPSVASMFTGAWPTIHGGLGRWISLTPIRDELPTAAEVFKSRGFTTLGLANAAFFSPMLKLDRGFDVFDHKYTYNWDSRRADETIDRALELIREHLGKPTFVVIHLFDPHLDYDPPSAYATKYTGGRREPESPLTMDSCRRLQTNDMNDPPVKDDVDYVRGVYQGEVAFLDAQIGRLIEALKSLDVYKRTTLIITADHGEEFWEHGDFEHGHTLYDELIRVPLIVKFPVDIPPARRVIESQVRLVDIMPTAFDILNIDKPETFVGESLMPLVMGEVDEDRPAFSESTLYGSDKISWRGPRYKYVHDLDENEKTGELYDWREDPLELNDLSAAHPKIASTMRTELLVFYTELVLRTREMSRTGIVDMSPQQIDKLRSLGYIR